MKTQVQKRFWASAERRDATDRRADHAHHCRAGGKQPGLNKNCSTSMKSEEAWWMTMTKRFSWMMIKALLLCSRDRD